MPSQCIIGLQWGDEAKGKLVDLLTEGKDLVVRYQGGANAGHTVVIGEDVYKLHHIPSGILNPGVLNLITAGVVINPPTLIQEIETLREKGVDVASRMKISCRAHVVMPWHMLEDRMWNRLVSGEDNIGTTLRGIGPCYADKVGRSFAIRMGDLIDDQFADKVARIVEVKKRVLAAAGNSEDAELDADQIVSEYRKYADALRPMITDTNRILHDAIEENQSLLFEGAQGSLLDVDHGTYPFVTSSNSSGVGISTGSGVPGNWLTNVIGVMKTYATRVGGGPFPTELEDETGQHIREMGNEYGTTTGRPRRCGWLDAVAVRYTARLGGVTSIALTMLDVLSKLPEIKICVAYELDGETISHFPAHVNDLRRLKPVWDTMPGWESDVTEARSLDDLPENAIRYILKIQQIVGRRVEFVSVGPDRAQTIQIPKDVDLAQVLDARVPS